MGISDHLACLLKNLYAGQEATIRIKLGAMDWLQIGKEVCQGCILSPHLFNFYAEYIMQNARLDEAQAGIKTAGRKTSITSDMQMTPPLCRKWRGTKEPLHESERGEWKAGLKLNIQKTKIMAPGPITSWQIDGETMETEWQTLVLGAPKSLQMVPTVMKLKDACSLEEKLSAA